MSVESSAIVHELEAYISLINKTVWEVRPTLEAMETFMRTCVSLDKEIAEVERDCLNFVHKM